jgi:hypothetical protein
MTYDWLYRISKDNSIGEWRLPFTSCNVQVEDEDDALPPFFTSTRLHPQRRGITLVHRSCLYLIAAKYYVILAHASTERGHTID